jgi:uncharacterized protein (TIGR04255 family)
MENYNDILYRQNKLTEVIARIDLVSPIATLANELPKAIGQAALQNFPVDEPKKAFAQEFAIAPDKLATRRTEFTEWNFHGENRGKRLALQPEAFFITQSRYESYEVLRELFLGISDVFFQTFEEAQPSRLGLRYINSINIGNGNPLDWGEYINNDLLGLFDFDIPDSRKVRVFHNLEYKYADFNIRFQFGMHNPDYPAVIRQKIFILDYDAYYKGAFEAVEIAEKLDAFHYVIQYSFERSITDRLREILNEDE